MADKIPWCKFWHSCLSDPDLEELELHNWARWARLIIFLRGHGDNGKMRLIHPALALQHTLRVQSYEELIAVIKLFRNVTLATLLQEPLQKPLHEPLQSYFITVRNWYKYQGDDSKERVRKYRVTRTVTKDVRCNALEKSRLDLTSTSTTSPATQSRALRRAPATQNGKDKGEEMNMEDLEIAEANKAWKKPEPERNGKRYEDAADDEMCGPPPDMLSKIFGGKK